MHADVRTVEVVRLEVHSSQVSLSSPQHMPVSQELDIVVVGLGIHKALIVNCDTVVDVLPAFRFQRF